MTNNSSPWGTEGPSEGPAKDQELPIDDEFRDFCLTITPILEIAMSEGLIPMDDPLAMAFSGPAIHAWHSKFSDLSPCQAAYEASIRLGSKSGWYGPLIELEKSLA